MNDLAFIYIVFAYLFMIGSAVADNEDENRSFLTYFTVVCFAPFIFPFALGS